MDDVVEFSQSKCPLSQGKQTRKRECVGFPFINDNDTKLVATYSNMSSSTSIINVSSSMSNAIKLLHPTLEIFDDMDLHLFSNALLEDLIKHGAFLTMVPK